jgi:hypothetical protein
MKAQTKTSKKSFAFLPLEEATNNLPYLRQLLTHYHKSKNLIATDPVTCYLMPVNYGGDVKTVWNKETIQGYKVYFTPKEGAEEAIAVNQTAMQKPDLTMVRLLTDWPLDILAHVLTYTQRDKAGMTKWIIFKPMTGPYLEMKKHTQAKETARYNKEFNIATK